jgi:hypothetical protein
MGSPTPRVLALARGALLALVANGCSSGLPPGGTWLCARGLLCTMCLTMPHAASQLTWVFALKFGAPLLCERVLSLLADEHSAIQTVWMPSPQQQSYTQGPL